MKDIIIGTVCVLILAGLAGQSDYEDALLEQAAYCDNVTLYHATAGTQGWPDYNRNYSELCEKNQNS